MSVARDLIARGFRVTDVDGSARQIEQARRNAPEAKFIQADMAAVEFLPFSFEAVSAFYIKAAAANGLRWSAIAFWKAGRASQRC